MAALPRGSCFPRVTASPEGDEWGCPHAGPGAEEGQRRLGNSFPVELTTAVTPCDRTAGIFSPGLPTLGLAQGLVFTSFCKYFLLPSRVLLFSPQLDSDLLQSRALSYSRVLPTDQHRADREGVQLGAAARPGLCLCWWRGTQGSKEFPQGKGGGGVLAGDAGDRRTEKSSSDA